MNCGLLIVERMVLESISRGNQKIQQISEDTSLKENFIKEILGLLKERGLIEGSDLFKIKEGERVKSLNSSEFVKNEIRDIFATHINECFEKEKKEQFKLKKFWMSSQDEVILKAHLKNLEDFIKGLPQNVGQKTKDQKVMFWGVSKYSDLAEGSLSAS